LLISEKSNKCLNFKAIIIFQKIYNLNFKINYNYLASNTRLNDGHIRCRRRRCSRARGGSGRGGGGQARRPPARRVLAVRVVVVVLGATLLWGLLLLGHHQLALGADQLGVHFGRAVRRLVQCATAAQTMVLKFKYFYFILSII
jgi:hypothetical protein